MTHPKMSAFWVINSGWTKKKRLFFRYGSKIFCAPALFRHAKLSPLDRSYSYFFLTDRGESAEQYSTMRIMDDDDEYLRLVFMIYRFYNSGQFHWLHARNAIPQTVLKRKFKNSISACVCVCVTWRIFCFISFFSFSFSFFKCIMKRTIK